MTRLRQVARRLGKRAAVSAKPAKTAGQADWYSLLTEADGMAKSEQYRVAMTVSCHDCDSIPKVQHAGDTKVIKKRQYQIMHNGILVESGGYFGDWMADIIKQLRGHHEPQEEKVFYELLAKLPPKSTMIELGSYWSYYSIWFNKAVPQARNICCEPDPKNLALGKRNAAINNAQNMTFIKSAAGSEDGKPIVFMTQEGEPEPVNVPIRSVDGIIREHHLKQVDIVHMDVQGAELDALHGCEQAVKQGRIRFMMISTHHYLISRDVLMHEKCLALIRSWGGHIVAEHAVHESYSGDGLIVASFASEDKKLNIAVSCNRLKDSLFRSYTEDIDLLIRDYEKEHDTSSQTPVRKSA